MVAFYLWTRTAMECSGLSGLFDGNLEDKNVESGEMMKAWLVKFQREV